MHRYLVRLGLVLLGLASAGCLVTQPQSTPVPALRLTEKSTKRPYWLYVPSTHEPTQALPMVVTLHGAGPWDSSNKQIREWKYLAEREGFIVVAPDIRSSVRVKGKRAKWLANLRSDESAVLAIMDEVSAKYGRAGGRVLLTGFLDGGYALYYIGLRNADRLNMLIARDCYTDVEMLEGVEPAKAARRLPMVVLNGKDGWSRIVSHSWRAYECLRKKGCFKARHKAVRGGQLRRPNKTLSYWRRYALGAGP